MEEKKIRLRDLLRNINEYEKVNIYGDDDQFIAEIRPRMAEKWLSLPLLESNVYEIRTCNGEIEIFIETGDKCVN